MTVIKISRKNKKATPLREIVKENRVAAKEHRFSRILTKREFERQNVIGEIVTGEKNFVEDLENVQTYGMKMMCSFTGEICLGIAVIFGFARVLRPHHENLIRELERNRGSFGEIFLEWLKFISSYESYCRDLVEAKIFYDLFKNQAKTAPIVNTWSKLPSSRRLDLWSFIDAPRSRLMKYPLLLGRLGKLSDSQIERKNISEAIFQIKSFLNKLEQINAEQTVRSILSRLVAPRDKFNNIPAIVNAKGLLLADQLSSPKGNKLQIFLFDNVLIITKEQTSYHNKTFQLVAEPMNTDEIKVEDISAGKRAHSFKVFDEHQKFVFCASSHYQKQNWINQFLCC